jgi:hypothetical protein
LLLSKSAINFIKSLELKLERELDGARAADLVQRVKTAALAAAAEIVVQHLHRVAELRRAEVVDGAAEVWVVEDVEKVTPELKREFLREPKLAAHS